LSGKHFVVRALINTWPAARLGLIASRKAAPRAVDRNRCKRLAREAFRSVKAKLPAVDVVFQQKNDLRKYGNLAIRRELDRLLREVAARFGSGVQYAEGAEGGGGNNDRSKVGCGSTTQPDAGSPSN
jgi:ribonuclease P protein component